METITKSYEDFLNDPVFRLTADKLILRAGISAKFKGATSLADTIILYGTDVSHKFCTLYKMSGDFRGLSLKTVMREISYAISQARDLADRLSKMIGAPIYQEDIHSGLVISYLGMIFKNPDLMVYS